MKLTVTRRLRRSFYLVVLCASAGLFASSSSTAAPGDLVTGFDGDGMATSDFGHSDYGSDVVIQADDRIVVGGRTKSWTGATVGWDFAMTRFNNDGSLDSSFGTGGQVITNISFRDDARSGAAVAMQSDGKLLITGLTEAGANAHNYGTVRYLSDGSVDTSFGGGGNVVTDLGNNDVSSDIAVTGDGKIVVVGCSGCSGSGTGMGVVRYKNDGTLDGSFAGGWVTASYGTQRTAATDVAIASDDQIVAAGYTVPSNGIADVALARFTTSGGLDTSFGTGGMAILDTGAHDGYTEDLAIQSDGKVVVLVDIRVDDHTHISWLVRYLANGTLDTSFSGDGIVEIAFGDSDSMTSLGIDSTGRLLVGGTSAVLVGYDKEEEEPIFDTDHVVIRYLDDGSLDTSFAAGGIARHDFGYAWTSSMGLLSNGDIVLAGSLMSDFFVARIEGEAGVTCPTVVGSGSFCSIDCPCLPGQGDCDDDSECGHGLTCVHNVGAEYGWDEDVDVCEDTCHPSRVGGSSFCSEDCLCDVGEGDCDGSEQCMPGLSCVRDVGADYGWDPDIDVCERTCHETRAGESGYCTPGCLCDEGEGDCDRDNECVAGLECMDDVGANYGWDPDVDVCEIPQSVPDGPVGPGPSFP